ncbi:MAG: nicotinate-nucleotide adenylyltransferase [Magnetovibrionaceae bacterium]
MPTLKRRARVGLLGGSFNPAHAGHFYISREALRLLDLDEVWWLVSPQNPLKPMAGMAPLEDRLESARSQARLHRIRVSALELELGTRFTADTVEALQRRFKGLRFVWLMGDDNLIQIHRWQAWTRLFARVPIAVFARSRYAQKALSSRAAKRFARARRSAEEAPRLADVKAPAWVFLSIPRHPASATRLRNRLQATRGAAQ